MHHIWDDIIAGSLSNFRQYGQMKKQRWEESEKRRAEERRSEKRKSEKKEDAGARKGRKVVTQCVYQWFVAPEGRKVGSLKRRVQSHVARWEMKNCTTLWREAHFQGEMYKTLQCRSAFGSWDVDEVRSIVAQRTCPSQNVQSTSAPDRFWKLKCRKSARRCEATNFRSQKWKKLQVRTTFGRSDVVRR